MASTANEADGNGGGALRSLTIVLGVGMVLVDVAVVYALLASLDAPAAATYGATALVLAVVGGSFLAVVARRMLGSDGAGDPADESTAARVTDVIFAVTVLTGVTVLLGSVGGLLLTLVASLGGPDPETADGDLLRQRLLEWADRNRAFVGSDGRGELPLSP